MSAKVKKGKETPSKSMAVNRNVLSAVKSDPEKENKPNGEPSEDAEQFRPDFNFFLTNLADNQLPYVDSTPPRTPANVMSDENDDYLAFYDNLNIYGTPSETSVSYPQSEKVYKCESDVDSDDDDGINIIIRDQFDTDNDD